VGVPTGDYGVCVEVAVRYGSYTTDTDILQAFCILNGMF